MGLSPDFRDVELFRSLVESAARCLEGPDRAVDRGVKTSLGLGFRGLGFGRFRVWGSRV